MIQPLKISQLGEFGLIRRLSKNIVTPTGGVGIGDDAAVIPLGSKGYLLFTTDMLLEGRHFRLGWGKAEWLGVKALRVNISDIAAMGGRPTYAVISLGIPAGFSVAKIQALYRGLRHAAREVGVQIVGGDTVRASQLTINVALLGVMKGRPVLRQGARAGDFIYLTGRIGLAAFALWHLQNRHRTRGRFLQRYWFPPCRVSLGQALARRGVHAMIDVSDGLVADLGHILASSHVGGELWIDAIPSASAPDISQQIRDRLILTGGDDYELLFTHSKPLPARLKGVPITRIGRILGKQQGLKILRKNGSESRLSGRAGFAHF